MIITLTGTNDFALSQALQQLRRDFVQEYTDMGLEMLDGAEIDFRQLSSTLQALPFLAAKKMIIFRLPSAQKSVQEALEQQLNNIPETTDLVIVEPKLDKRTSYYKVLQKQTDFREFKELDDRALAQWLVDQAKAEHGTLSQADALYLVHRVGANQMLLNNEVQKLLSYQPAITRESIDELTDKTTQSSVFDLLDAALSGQQAKTVALYHEQRQQKVEPLAIMGMLAWQLHILALVKTGEGHNIASEAKVNPYVLSKTQSVARRCSLAELKNWVHEAAQLDVRLKRQSIDADEAVMDYLLSFTS